MAQRQGTVIHSRTPRPGQTCTEDSQQRPFTHVRCQSRATSQKSKKCEWNPRHCQWLKTWGRSAEPTHISTRDYRDQPETRHGNVVTFNHTSSLGWTDSTTGRVNWGELRKKLHKVSGTHRELCWKRFEGMVFPVEVGCRGFPAQSLWRTISRLGITGRSRKRALSAIAQETEGSSLLIWQKREERWVGGHSAEK